MDTFGTSEVNEEELLKLIKNVFNFSPRNIREELSLGSVKYYELAKYGHVGRDDLKLPWEKLSHLTEVLSAGAKLIHD